MEELGGRLGGTGGAGGARGWGDAEVRRWLFLRLPVRTSHTAGADSEDNAGSAGNVNHADSVDKPLHRDHYLPRLIVFIASKFSQFSSFLVPSFPGFLIP